nr:MAG TPA: hypothetical protein [Herelleviridae sp.]
MEMIKTYDGTYYYNTHNNYTFIEIYPDAATFLADYGKCELPTTISDDYATILYYNLLGRKANDSILSNSLGQFKYRLFSLIWQFGPYWQKQIELQEKSRGLTDDDIRDGSKQIYNRGSQPAQKVTAQDGNIGTQSKAEIRFVNDQNVTLNTKSKLEAYTIFGTVLKSDVSEGFFRQFDELFQFSSSLGALLYCNEEDT